MKKENAQVVRLDEVIELDGFCIEYVVFDLMHINYGWSKERKDYNKNRRSDFDKSDVIELFEMTDMFLRD